MDGKRREALIRKFGTAGVNMFVHLECRDSLLERIAQEGRVIQDDRIARWKPKELIGRFSDIVHCDECGRKFHETDRGYVSYWITSPEELEVWERIKADPRPEP